MSGNSKIVRKLLLRGANREIRDNNRKRPMDLAIECKFMNIANMLMIQNCIRNLANIRPTYKPNENRYFEICIFLVLFLYCSAVTIIFTFPFYHFLVDLMFLIFDFATIIVLIMLQIKNPGYLSTELK